ncbi:Hypothetical Protein OBI_RACECAR_260 [Arthrobacter phage Racecar]|nr:hypothetical protein PBI_RACECAR_52 [Arthrobacter phage Racecar]QFG12736.1 hypothetical protein PBI_MIMI_52 [Arthrobacter phage Mimi]
MSAYDRLRERLESTRGGFLTDLEVSVSDLEELLDEVGSGYEYAVQMADKWSGKAQDLSVVDWMSEEEARKELAYCLKNNKLRMEMGRKLFNTFALVRRRKAGEIEVVDTARQLP